MLLETSSLSFGLSSEVLSERSYQKRRLRLCFQQTEILYTDAFLLFAGRLLPDTDGSYAIIEETHENQWVDRESVSNAAFVEFSKLGTEEFEMSAHLSQASIRLMQTEV